MKIIPKLLKGGSSYLSLFADYNLIERPTSLKEQSGGRRQSSGEDKSDKGKLTEKDLFSLLKDVDGLPNEMLALVRDILNMYEYNTLIGGDFDTQGLANLYAQNLYALKRANFNKNEYDKAYKQVEQKQGLNEFAVTANGKLLVQTEDGNMTQIGVKEFFDNSDKYQALTNSNLLWYRAHDPRFINENLLVFDTVSNGIGLSEIHKMIKERMTNLGITEQSQSGYIAKKGDKIMQGLQVLEGDAAKEAISKGMTLDGIYKSEIINKTQKEQAQAALQYIYSTLPENAKTILALHSGNKDNPAQGALNIITQMIASTLDETQSIKFSFQNDLNLDGKSSSSSGSGKGPEDIKETVASMFLKGYGNQEVFSINPGTNLSVDVITNTLPLVDKSGNPLGNMCSLQEVSEGQFAGILDWNHATMGGRLIKTEDLRRILSSDGQVYSIDFPVDENGNPDLRPTTIQAKNKADEMMKSAGIDINNPESRARNADKMNQILQECGLTSAYDSQGNIIGNNWARFAVMNGIADSKGLGMGDLDDAGMLLQEVNEDRQNSILEILQSKSTNPKDKYKFDDSSFIFFHGDDYLYEGTIWIPVKSDHMNALFGSEIKQGQGFQLEEMQRVAELREQQNKNQLLSLWKKPDGN